MTSSSISNLSILSGLTSNLQTQVSSLTQLSSQLSSGQIHANLTDYTPSQAQSLINLQSTATQRQAYVSVINNVNTKLSTYDTTMTDMESIVMQAQTLSNSSASYSTNTASNILIEANNYLRSVGLDLNQQLNGQYIYAGTRYTTTPVADLTALPASTLSSTIYSDNATLPSYDSQYATSALTMTTSGQTVTVGGTVGTPQDASITVNNQTYTYAIQSGDTTSTIASSLAALVAANVSGTSATGSVITVGGTGTINSASAYAASAAAYTTDNAPIDTGETINYGVSSNNSAFQQIIAGLRYMQAAGNSTTSTTYQSNIQEASTLLTSGLSALQLVHTDVANNINTLTTAKNTQTADIAALTNQVDNIQQVDTTQVAAEITSLETILQASYSVTGIIEKMSIVSYL